MDTQNLKAFKTGYQFQVIPDEAAYKLTIESQVPIETLFFQSSINVDILNLDQLPVKYNICAQDPSNPDSMLSLIMTCTSKMTRFDFKIRTSEGLFGELNIFLIPAEDDSNVSRAIRVPMKPLNLHAKVEGLPDDEEGLGLSQI